MREVHNSGIFPNFQGSRIFYLSSEENKVCVYSISEFVIRTLSVAKRNDKERRGSF